MKKSLQEHLNPSTCPNRNLSLDGGVIKGALGLGYLQRIEEVLRHQNGNDPEFRLSDYFDMIEMGNAKNRFILYEIGSKNAQDKLMTSHFPETFKIQ